VGRDDEQAQQSAVVCRRHDEVLCVLCVDRADWRAVVAMSFDDKGRALCMVSAEDEYSSGLIIFSAGQMYPLQSWVPNGVLCCGWRLSALKTYSSSQ
jgi:hypothetical protein